MPSLLRIPWISRGWSSASIGHCCKMQVQSLPSHYRYQGTSHAKMGTIKDRNGMDLTAGVQPWWIQGIQSGDGVGEDQETTA